MIKKEWKLGQILPWAKSTNFDNYFSFWYFSFWKLGGSFEVYLYPYVKDHYLLLIILNIQYII